MPRQYNKSKQQSEKEERTYKIQLRGDLKKFKAERKRRLIQQGKNHRKQFIKRRMNSILKPSRGEENYFEIGVAKEIAKNPTLTRNEIIKRVETEIGNRWDENHLKKYTPVDTSSSEEEEEEEYYGDDEDEGEEDGIWKPDIKPKELMEVTFDTPDIDQNKMDRFIQDFKDFENANN